MLNSEMGIKLFSDFFLYFIPILFIAMYLKYKIAKWTKPKKKEKSEDEKTNKKYKYKYKYNNNKINDINIKEKGEKYEAFICEKYKQLGYTIAEHGKDNGVRDQGIDIIAKKNKEILFIQCKDWNVKSGYKINHKEIQYIRMNVRDYIKRNPLYKNYDWKILYITSDNILDKSGHYKIVENSDEIEHRIIPI